MAPHSEHPIEDNAHVRFASSPSHAPQARPLSSSSSTPDQDWDGTLDETIMALDYRDRKIGCCYLNAIEGKLWMMEDMEESAPWDLVEALRFHVQPSTILLSSRMDESLLDKLEGLAAPANPAPSSSSESATPGTESTGFALDIRPATEFAYQTARSRLISLRVGTEEGPRIDFAGAEEGNGQREGLMRLAGWVDVDSKVTVGCVGAVIAYFARRRLIGGIHGDDEFARVSVNAISMFSMNDYMLVNADTICSLQIFEDESHPNFHMQGRGGRGKEGLSLFGIMNSTRTPQGSVLLHRWFLRPSLNLDILHARHSTLSLFLHPSNLHVSDALCTALKKVKDMGKILLGLRSGKSGGTAGEWQRILDFIWSTIKIRGAIEELFQTYQNDDALPIIQHITNNFDIPALTTLGTLLTSTIDFDTSTLEHRTVIARGVDDELDNMKHVYDGLDSMLAQAAAQLAERVPREVAGVLNVIYFPQLGYLITVPAADGEEGGGEGGGGGSLWEGEGWEFQFNTATCFYYKSVEMRELDEYFGDIHGLIVDREIELVYQLQLRVLESSALLAKTSDICAELDCLLALAESARKFGYQRPRMVEENVIRITKGRHPLQELLVASIVENDTNLAGGRGTDAIRLDGEDGEEGELEVNSAMLLTGANFSGKSVYLKQVALIVYLAHVGSYVPAESATIGLTDKILTRIQTRESVSKMQSAFMIDLQQISLALRAATRRSLLIIDEFGKGTESTDGAGLFCGVLDWLLRLGEERPKVLAATHYHEIFEGGFLEPDLPLSYAHMEIILDPSSSTDANPNLTYLYHLRPGRSLSSFGTHCAANAGIAPEIIERAEKFVEVSARGEDIASVCALGGGNGEREKKELEDAEVVARRFLEWEINCDDGNVRDVLARVLVV
ncbi:chaperone ATPase hsp78 [Saitoella coloradoensis]